MVTDILNTELVLFTDICVRSRPFLPKTFLVLLHGLQTREMSQMLLCNQCPWLDPANCGPLKIKFKLLKFC